MSLVGMYDQWLDFVRDLLARPQHAFPRAAVARMFSDTFDTGVVSWNWLESNRSFGVEFDRRTMPWNPTDYSPNVVREVLHRHPLVQWFVLAGDPRPMSVGRVPRHLVPEEDFGLQAGMLRDAGLDQQLSIPYRLGPAHHRAFVLARGPGDFSDEDLDLARRIQPLLALLERHACATQSQANASAAETGLTPREIAVLSLLAEGMTAVAIARKLGISPRTVHQHLQHIYRKLGVDDRMRAVLAAQTLGLLATAVTSRRRLSRVSPIHLDELTSIPNDVLIGQPLCDAPETRCTYPPGPSPDLETAELVPQATAV